MQPATICLGVAIDHRIRRLFHPVTRPAHKAEDGNHVSILKAQGHKLGLAEAEIKVTTELAGPSTTGGIAIALQQPRENHPFEKGSTAVIQDCETLRVLDVLYDIASCGTVNLLDHVSVIDLLPYTTEKQMKTLNDDSLTELFATFTHSICGKEPDVILCAGKVWLDDSQRHCKGSAWTLETKGIGETFDKYPYADLFSNNNKLVRIKRVNGFHPSHAINHHPERSCLIQLILLIVSQTCGILRNQWQEEQWMSYLRINCQDLHREQKRKLRYLSDFAEYYGGITARIKETIGDIAESYGEPYDGLLQMGLSELFNDASLCLREMHRLKAGVTSKWAASKDDKALRQASEYTKSLMEGAWHGSEGWFDSTEIKDILMKGLDAIGKCSSISSGNDPVVDLQRASLAFLKTAEEIEMILWKLKPKTFEELLEDLVYSFARLAVR